jgi:hypothetical protein
MFTRLSEVANFAEEVMFAFVTDGDSHCIGIDVKTDEGYDGSIDLFLFFVWEAKIVPQFENLSLVHWEVMLVFGVVLDIPKDGKRAVVINIALEVFNMLNV